MATQRLMAKCLLFYSAHCPYHRGKWRLVWWLRRHLDLTVEGERQVRRGGLWWLLNPADHVQTDLYWLGVTNRWEIRHIKRRLGKGSVFFDVGANIGYYSVTLAAQLEDTCRVYAFEPNPSTYGKLLRNCELNHLTGVRAYCMALSNKKGQAGMALIDGNSGAAHLVEGHGTEVNTLDSFCGEQGIDRLDFIKIDVEGAEERMLHGSLDTLNRFKPGIQIELNPPVLTREGTGGDGIGRVLAECGYRFYRIQRDRLGEIAKLPEANDISNVFCFHHERPLHP